MDEKRIEFWDYLTNEKGWLPPVGVTQKRLAKVRDAVLADDRFWMDIIDRHGAREKSAAEFYGEDSFNAGHSRSNFWAMVREKIFLTEGDKEP